MKVILLQNVKALGKKDDVVEVAEGYAANFLLPRKLAIRADNQAMNDLKGKEESKRFKIEEERKAAKAIAERLASITVKIRSASGADGRLYGAVTSKDVAEALAKDFGITVDKRKIEMSDNIKSYGSYTLNVKLYEGVVGKIALVVHN